MEVERTPKGEKKDMWLSYHKPSCEVIVATTESKIDIVSKQEQRRKEFKQKKSEMLDIKPDCQSNKFAKTDQHI